LASFIRTQHQRIFRRAQIQTNDILQSLSEQWVFADFERIHQMRFQSLARQMRRTLASLMPASAAIVPVLQCVALAGSVCLVLSIKRCTAAALIVGLRPGRGASLSSPLIPVFRKRFRQRAAL
jgi:hypothetical protein